MSCFFCSSLYHVSFNCDVYPTNKLRKKFISTKANCRHCLAPKDEKELLCSKCNNNEKCYICFSKLHHSVYCNDRFTASNLFPPNIDINLLSRFTQFLQFEELYFMAFSYPYIFDAVTLQPLKISYHEDIKFPCNKDYSNADLVVVDKVCICTEDHYISPLEILKPTYFNSLIFHVRHLEITKKYLHSKGNILSKELLLLLSVKLKTFRCGAAQFLPKLTFREIIKKAPNLEVINLVHTDVEMGNSWPEILLHYNHGNNFKQLYLTIPDLKFNVNALGDLMKKMSSKTQVFHLYIDLSCFPKGALQKIVDEEVGNYFDPVQNIGLKCFNLFYINKSRNC